jgi:ribonuclease P protein component
VVLPVSRPRSLPRAERLRRAGEIQAVFQQGQREESRSFVAVWRPGAQGPKVGFAVSRRVRGAVRRNRARRRLREAYRRQEGALPAGIQVVFVGRPASLTERFSRLLEDMQIVIARLSEAMRRAAPTPGPGARPA